MDMATRSRDDDVEDLVVPQDDARAVPLIPGLEPLRRETPRIASATPQEEAEAEVPLEAARALVPSDLAPPAANLGDRLTRIAYRMGLPAGLR